MKRLVGLVNQLLDVPTTDPDDARRRKLLNILLLGLAIVGLLAFIATITVDIIGTIWESNLDRLTAYAGSLSLLIGPMIIYAINRYIAGWLASTLLLLLLVAGVAFSDTPQEVAGGRGLLMFAIPIMMGSVLLRPYASFVMAGLSSIVLAAVASSLGWVPNPFAMLTFFLLALVSWLAARSLEQALKDLRTLNLELDQRVRDRTRELAESLSKTEAILASTADGIIVFDTNGKAAVANPALAGLLARPIGEIVDRDIEELMSDTASAEDREVVAALLAGIQEARFPSVKVKWGKKTLSVSVAPVRLESDEEIGTVAVFRDFTREAEIDRMKSTFVSIASHELRTPLNALLGYTEMLKEGVYGDLTERQEGAVGRLVANTNHMLSLVNNLLDRARIEAGTLRLNISSFSAANLIDGVVGVMEVAAQNKGLELTSYVGEDVPHTLKGDWQRLHQILINFVNNAVKFTEKGAVDVRIYMRDADHWAMSVTDTGIGIPEDARGYIFEPFRQVDESATREYGGAGLGLSIVKQLVELMGGWIELESEVGQGSAFTVVLPLELNVPEGAVED
jgi:PAS domain S-box-containing protein